MKVYIKLSSWFKRYTGGNSNIEVSVNEGSTAYETICTLGIPRSEIGFVTVESAEQNGQDKRIDESYKVAGGEVIKVYPLIIGG